MELQTEEEETYSGDEGDLLFDLSQCSEFDDVESVDSLSLLDSDLLFGDKDQHEKQENITSTFKLRNITPPKSSSVRTRITWSPPLSSETKSLTNRTTVEFSVATMRRPVSASYNRTKPLTLAAPSNQKRIPITAPSNGTRVAPPNTSRTLLAAPCNTAKTLLTAPSNTPKSLLTAPSSTAKTLPSNTAKALITAPSNTPRTLLTAPASNKAKALLSTPPDMTRAQLTAPSGTLIAAPPNTARKPITWSPDELCGNARLSTTRPSAFREKKLGDSTKGLLPSPTSEKSTIIKLNQPPCFRYIPEELPFVELPELAKKKPHFSQRKRAFTVSSEDTPSLLLETKRSRTDEPDLRTVLTFNRSESIGRQRSLSEDSTCVFTTQSAPVKQERVVTLQDSVAGTSDLTGAVSSGSRELDTRTITFESMVSNQETSASNTTSPVKGGLSLNRGMHRKNIFASRPNIGCYRSSGMGEFSLKHLGDPSPDFVFSLNHL